jgi:hypothetical protein
VPGDGVGDGGGGGGDNDDAPAAAPTPAPGPRRSPPPPPPPQTCGIARTPEHCRTRTPRTPRRAAPSPTTPLATAQPRARARRNKNQSGVKPLATPIAEPERARYRPDKFSIVRGGWEMHQVSQTGIPHFTMVALKEELRRQLGVASLARMIGYMALVHYFYGIMDALEAQLTISRRS